MRRKVIVSCVFSILLISVILLFRYISQSDMAALTENKTIDLKEVGEKQVLIPQLSSRGETQKVDPDSFYQTIIDNNIFRPLNWKPTQKASAYRLLGTTIPSNGDTATAYIQERQSGQLYSVKVGDPLGESTVQNITSKRVILTTKNGNTSTLSISGNVFLNPRHTQSRRSHERIAQNTQTKENNPSQKSRVHTTTPQITPQEWRENLQERADSLRAERTRMQERLRYLEQR